LDFIVVIVFINYTCHNKFVGKISELCWLVSFVLESVAVSHVW